MDPVVLTLSSRLILARRFMAPEVYDLASRLGTLSVQHAASHIRSSCRQMLGMFLLHYPLGNKRMEQQITFFVDNLSYVHESGTRGGHLREACIRSV